MITGLPAIEESEIPYNFQDFSPFLDFFPDFKNFFQECNLLILLVFTHLIAILSIFKISNKHLN